MFNVLFAADFPIAKTGIESTATSILAAGVIELGDIYSEQPLSINGILTKSINELGDTPIHFIFTHLECSSLPALHKRYPKATVHVGDWSLTYWSSIRKFQFFKGLLGYIRCSWRLRRLNCGIKFVFVTREDCRNAIAYGFSNAEYLPIGVNTPSLTGASQIDTQSICFSGNFRYEPNKRAANRLLNLAKTRFPGLKIILIGYYADDFKNFSGINIEIHADVPSVIDLLAVHRPVYVSLIDSGAGAKNKVLEAIVAGCPIICTKESLDSSIPVSPSISVITSDEDVVACLARWCLPSHSESLKQASDLLATETKEHRSWAAVARMARNLITLP